MDHLSEIADLVRRMQGAKTLDLADAQLLVGHAVALREQAWQQVLAGIRPATVEQDAQAQRAMAGFCLEVERRESGISSLLSDSAGVCNSDRDHRVVDAQEVA